MNLLDRVISYVSPEAGARRVSYRRKLEIHRQARAYEAASGGRLAGGRPITTTTADAEIGRAGHILRARSRDLDRNNPIAVKAITVHANHLVGYGITPRAKMKNPDHAAIVNNLFAEWSKVAFTGSNLNFNGGCYQLARMLVGDGEVYVRRRARKLSDGLPVPLQLQILEAEYCDWSKTGPVAGHPGNAMVQGIELDAIGNRRGYWMFPQHPGSLAWWQRSVKSSFVPAEDIAHLYEPQGNQMHGVPWITPSINEIYDLKDYELSENIRKKIESCVVGMVTPGDEDTDASDPNVGLEEPKRDKGGPSITDIYGNPFDRMEPGMFGVLRGGKDIRFNTPAISAGIEGYIRTRLRSIAAGVRLPYELLTGDFSQSNFASGKLGLNDYYGFVELMQCNFIIPMVLDRVWSWFIEAAKISGKIPSKWDVKVEWETPEVESITRLDDARADLIEMRMGKRSPQEIIGKTGRDPFEVLREIDEWNQAVDKTATKVVLDSDPRKVSMSGQMQLSASADNAGGSGKKRRFKCRRPLRRQSECRSSTAS